MSMYETRDEYKQRLGFPVKTVAGVAIASAIGLATAFNSFYTVGETERGLIYTFSKLTTTDAGNIVQPGIHFKIPFAQHVRHMPVGVNEVNLRDINIYTRDSQDLNAVISYQYEIPESSLITIAKKLPTNDNVSSIVENTVLQALKASFGQTEATDVPQERNEVMKSATENADSLLYRDWNINVKTINMPNFEFNPIFKSAIANATEMKADAERARQEVEKTKAEADSAVAKATGQANAERTAADAALYVAQKRADAQLYATEKASAGQKLLISVIGEDNAPAYWFNEKWNGVTPTVMGGSNVSVTDMSSAIVPSQAKAVAPTLSQQ